uniref:Uncharacterized protein n=1 Tax=Chromera velia CCMP2878 TaxID=1169474 RepID=A0A0G4GIG0_9ALVE|eukprot:Cvel_4754.t1-p1 / transcript=Cvel_4754.t1 / gene=Cvel_4754 / organism=Chromera_velia_CCMP2878 / gene_product=hypothetical protein / transcript_product=hypothetical protein / location=Cvel_scaffold212:16188-24000(+) / protein_length=1639 / sequence_SO=supercontig / SO=protein_coding / is_pseudo=false
MEEPQANGGSSSREMSPSSKSFSVLASSGCFENRGFWKLTSLSHSLRTLRKDETVLRCSLHSNTVKDREELCVLGIFAVKNDNLDELMALISCDRLPIHWRLPKDETGKELPCGTTLTQIAMRHSAIRCQRALTSLQPLLPSPEPFHLLTQEQADKPSSLLPVRIALESKQIDPNGTVKGAPWLFCCLREGLFPQAALLIEQGARVDIWDYSYSSWGERTRLSGQSSLHQFVETSKSTVRMADKVPSRLDVTQQLVQAAKTCGILEWAAWDSENRRRGTALVLAVLKIAEKREPPTEELTLIQELVRAGADVRAKDDRGLSVLHILSSACERREEYGWVVDGGLEVQEEEGQSGEEEVIHLSLIDSFLSCERSLINSGPLVRFSGGKGRFTPVMVAAELGFWGIVGVLVERGADVDIGRTETEPHECLLHLAATDGWKGTAASVGLLKQILSLSKNVNAVADFSQMEAEDIFFPPSSAHGKEQKWNAVEWACLRGDGKERKWNAVEWACLRGDGKERKWNAVEWACLRGDGKEREWNAVEWACLRGDGKERKWNAVEWACLRGDGKERKWNAVEWACLRGDMATAWWLHEKFPSLSIHPEAVIKGEPAAVSEFTLRLFEVSVTIFPIFSADGGGEGGGTRTEQSQNGDRALWGLVMFCVHLKAHSFLSLLLPRLLQYWKDVRLRPQDLDTEKEGTPLHVLSRMCSVDLLSSLLVELGWDPNTPSVHLKGGTPLMVAGESPTLQRDCEEWKECLEKTVNTLVEAGGDVSRRDAEGRTALRRAIVWFYGSKRSDSISRSERLRERLKVLQKACLSPRAGVPGQWATRAAVRAVLRRDERIAVEHFVSNGGEPVVRCLLDSLPRILKALGCKNSPSTTERTPDVEDRRKCQWLGSILWRECRDAVQPEHTETRVRIVESFVDKRLVGGLLRKSLRRVWKETTERVPWESGCVDCNFVFQVSDPAGLNWGRDATMSIIAELKHYLVVEKRRLERWPESLEMISKEDLRRLVRSEHEARIGLQYVVLQELSSPQAQLRGAYRTQRSLNEEMEQILLAEAERWEQRLETQTMRESDIPSGNEYNSVRSVRASFLAQAKMIKDAHVRAIFWCMEKVKMRFRTLCIGMSKIDPDVKQQIDILFDLEEDTEEEEKQGNSTPPEDDIPISCPTEKAPVNMKLYRIAQQLISKAEDAETGWSGTPPLCFPLYPPDLLTDGRTRRETDRVGGRPGEKAAGEADISTEGQQGARLSGNLDSSSKEGRKKDGDSAEDVGNATAPSVLPPVSRLVLFYKAISTPKEGEGATGELSTGGSPDAPPDATPTLPPTAPHENPAITLKSLEECLQRNAPDFRTLTRSSLGGPEVTAGVIPQAGKCLSFPLPASLSPPSASSAPIYSSAGVLGGVRGCHAGLAPLGGPFTKTLSVTQCSPKASAASPFSVSTYSNVAPLEGSKSLPTDRQGSEVSATPIHENNNVPGLPLFSFGASLKETEKPEKSSRSDVKRKNGEHLSVHPQSGLLGVSSRGLSKDLFQCGQTETQTESESESGSQEGRGAVLHHGSLKAAEEEGERGEQSEGVCVDVREEALPLCLQTLHDKARAMLYSSETEFRSDLTTLWRNAYRFHGNRASSHLTLAAWTLMKWGCQMLERAV